MPHSLTEAITSLYKANGTSRGNESLALVALALVKLKNRPEGGTVVQEGSRVAHGAAPSVGLFRLWEVSPRKMIVLCNFSSKEETETDIGPETVSPAKVFPQTTVAKCLYGKYCDCRILCRTHRVPTYSWYFPSSPPSPSSWPVSDYYYKCLICHIQASGSPQPIHFLKAHDVS